MAASVDRATSLEEAWTQRLGYQRKDLPPFEDVLKEVRTVVVWRSSEAEPAG